MLDKTKSDLASVDVGFSIFYKRFKYELIASFALVSLIAGIVTSFLYLQNQPEKIEFENQAEEDVSEAFIFVHVAGAVGSPGVYEMPDGSRVQDALLAANDTSEEADGVWVDEMINRAKVLTDGEKIFIPFKQDIENDANFVEEKVNSGLVNINTASVEALTTLPGIGDSYANRIIDGRPYTSVEEITKVKGISVGKLNEIRDKISVY